MLSACSYETPEVGNTYTYHTAVLDDASEHYQGQASKGSLETCHSNIDQVMGCSGGQGSLSCPRM
jgi:hypothetical protein